MFIKVHAEFYKDDDTANYQNLGIDIDEDRDVVYHPIYLNIDKITVFGEVHTTGKTQIGMLDDITWIVQETPEQIKELL